MSLSAAALRKMREMGLTADQMIELAEVVEASLPKSAGAERTRRWRERRAQASQSMSLGAPLEASPRDVTEETSQSPALDKETPPAPPKEINPSPKALAEASAPTAVGARPSDDRSKVGLKRIAEEIWALQPILGGKRRATRPDVARALAAAARRGGDPADILACCRAYYALPDCTKHGGRFAKGAAELIAADRWAEYRPAPGFAPSAAVVTWTGPKPVLDAVLSETDDGFVKSYLLTAEWVPPEADGAPGAIRPRTSYAFDKLSRLQRLKSLVRLLPPSPRSYAA